MADVSKDTIRMAEYWGKNTLYKLCKYGIAGGIGAAIDFGLFTVIISCTSILYLLANVISFSIGTIVTYYMQKNWTFRFHHEQDGVVFGKFAIVVVITFILNNAILVICVSFLFLNPVLSKIIQILLSFFWGFTINSKFVFR
jgi:putative flippase GtrA